MVHPLVQFGMLPPLVSQNLFHQSGVFDAHGDDAQAFLRALPGVLENQFHHPGRLPRLFARSARVVVGQHVVDAVIVGGSRKSGERTAVEGGLGVGEGDQPFVAGTVMPTEVAGAVRRGKQSCHHVQDGFKPAGQRGGIFVIIVFFFNGPKKKAGGRQLFGIPGHHHFPGSHNGADGVGGGDLRGLVEYHHIEQLRLRQGFRHQQRAHRPAGFERPQHVGCLLQQSAHRHMSSFAIGLFLHQSAFFGKLVSGVSGPLRHLAANAIFARLNMLMVHPLILFNRPIQNLPCKVSYQTVFYSYLVKQALIPNATGQFHGFLRVQPAAGRFHQNLFQPAGGKLQTTFCYVR